MIVKSMIEKDPVCGRDVQTDHAIVVFKLGEHGTGTFVARSAPGSFKRRTSACSCKFI